MRHSTPRSTSASRSVATARSSTRLRTYAGTGVPVFGINFGEMGFLATVDREECASGCRRALAGDFEVLSLPAIRCRADGASRWRSTTCRSTASRASGSPTSSTPSTATRSGGCAATGSSSRLRPARPATTWPTAVRSWPGAWQGYVVSFIAPHSLTARTLVVAPDDRLSVHNRSQEEPVDVTVDGRPICVLQPGERLEARFAYAGGRWLSCRGRPSTTACARSSAASRLRCRRCRPAPRSVGCGW